ncbi:beta strand repeat-containing protein [Pseudorhizobium flavum]|uniref:Ca2+-binding RTX toxin-like protein n=1 Tax=Pseudorhizobium flavum TaxID=1335061 RepID=A0A7X0DER1_9HYPH|nr:DUF4214 domain-containing protein [Pseudorhizobium flavum]MBB6182075.1 Ca2+-binding RTX toxin-like protein [Pseudorhizobium flavum]CAD6632202.1 hypothetical protein RFYW14_04626 [Pseudorhizobium flavum]
MATIQGIYIALFGRPADPLGLAYFEAETNGGADLTAIGDLAATAEYQNRFEGMSNVEIVNSIYQSLYGRDADLAGLTFFVNALQDGTYNINNIAIAILDGAQGNDAAILANKLEAANLFTASLDTGSEVVAYQGDDAAAAGRAFLSGVTSDDATVPTQAEVDAAVEAIVDASDDVGPGTPGSIFTLTDASNTTTGGVDNVVGTANDDNIRAISGGSLDSGDVINGGAGYDTLNISDDAYVANAAPVISGVERINNGESVALDLTDVSGVQQIWSSNAAGATYDNASLSTVFGTTVGGTIDIDIEASTAGNSDTLRLAVDDNNGTDAVFTSGTDAASIENIVIDAQGASGTSGTNATADDVVLTAFTGLETLTVTGAGNINIVAAAPAVAPAVPAITSLTTVDASAATGSVTVDASESTEDMTFTGGSGANDFTSGSGDDVLNGGAGNDTLDAGAGDDTLTLNGGDTATGGADEDVFNVSGGIALGAGNEITDFVLADDDAIEFGGAAGTTTNYAESTTTAGSFSEAREIASTEFAGNADLDYVAVWDGTDVHLFYNGGSGDDLVSAVTLTGAVTLATIDHTAII